MKAIVQKFHVALFIMLYKVNQTFESVYEIQKCDHSNETELLSSTYKVVLTFESVGHCEQPLVFLISKSRACARCEGPAAKPRGTRVSEI